eukprot:GEMP01049589.1.p1 GENE.GEMP01049589.1~~GEMP01049589.1.p1  ORF type:complete len:494 (+),score=35.27 GEMP01049589.1:55-1536(+)
MLTYASCVRLTFGVACGVRSTELLQGFRCARVATPGLSSRHESKFHQKAPAITSAFRLFVSGLSYRELPLPTFLQRGTEEDKERFALLMERVEEARTPRDRSAYQKRTKRGERIDLEGKLRCAKCGVFQEVEFFSLDSSSAYGRNSYCKVCAADWTRIDNGSTLRRIMNHILCNAKTSALARSRKPFREAAGEFDLSVDDLLELWEKQQGRCAYSEVVLNSRRYTPWRLSLERCNNTLGYTRENIVFVCGEFNTMDQSVRASGNVQGSSKWFRCKVQSLPERIQYSTPLDNFELNKMLSTTCETKDRNHSLAREVAANGGLRCSSCSKFKSPDDFYASQTSSVGKRSQCKVCEKGRQAKYRRMALGFFRVLLNSAKLTAKHRANKGRHAAGEFRLEFDDLIKMYQQQRGLCFYSGVKMNLQPYTDWKCSIERIDNTKGYIPNNVALICSEFQTSDYASRANIPVEGSPQWSKDKVVMLMEWLRLTKSVVSEGS